MHGPERRADYAAWVESFGFSDDDKRRIKLLAGDVTQHSNPPALVDLSVPIRVCAVLESHRRYFGGDTLGVVTFGDGPRVAVLYWVMTETDRRASERRRK